VKEEPKKEAKKEEKADEVRIIVYNLVIFSITNALHFSPRLVHFPIALTVSFPANILCVLRVKFVGM